MTTFRHAFDMKWGGGGWKKTYLLGFFVKLASELRNSVPRPQSESSSIRRPKQQKDNFALLSNIPHFHRFYLATKAESSLLQVVILCCYSTDDEQIPNFKARKITMYFKNSSNQTQKSLNIENTFCVNEVTTV
jgi:hypothetical protein